MTCKYCGKVLPDSFILLEPDEGNKTEDLWEATEKGTTKEDVHGKKRNRRKSMISGNMASFSTISERNENISNRIENYDEDVEICLECNHTLLEMLKHLILEEEKELGVYSEQLRLLKEEEKFYDQIETFGKQQKEENTLSQRIQSLEQEHHSLDERFQSLEKDLSSLEIEENKYWQAVTTFQQRVLYNSQQMEISTSKNFFATERLHDLKKRNVYQDTFFIFTQDSIGAINNFRFGRLPSVPVEWEEINAAWGQVVLLVHILCRKLEVDFTNHQLILRGSRCKIKTKDDNKEYLLYGSEELGFTSWFWSFARKQDSSFEEGMVAFLACLKQLCDTAKKYIKIPHEISNDKIGSQSIRMESNTEEVWTAALKNVLVNLNHILAWKSNPKATH